MQLLIVDDEMMAIQGISMLLEWKEIGIEQVWTAMTLAEARSIIAEEEIDLLLCDIEMRSENGLHLVDWVNKNYPLICCIILTGHVNFDYTRKAIELKVMDYLSKPIDARSLKISLAKAVNKRNQNRKKQEVEVQNKKAAEWYMFRYLLRGGMSREEIRSELIKHQLSMPLDGKYCMLFVKIRKWNEEYEESEKDKVNMLMSTTLMQDYFAQYHIYAQKISRDSMIICFASDVKDAALDRICERSEKFVSYCKTYFLCELCIYIASQICIEELGAKSQYLQEFDRNNFLRNQGVMLAEKKKKPDIYFTCPDWKVWKLLLTQHAYESLKADINSYMESEYLVKNINPSRMQKIIEDFEDMFVVMLSERGIEADLVKNQPRIRALREGAGNSISQCIEWMHGCADCIAMEFDEEKKQKSVAEVICDYLNEHPFESVSRDELASLVYMSPDHMAKIFKKEMGMTISDYLIEIKMQQAAQLLVKTEFSVSYIASNIGYSNISHFSGAFKKQYGLTPSEYRRQHSRISD